MARKHSEPPSTPREVSKSEPTENTLRIEEQVSVDIRTTSRATTSGLQSGEVSEAREKWIADASLLYDQALRQSGIERKEIADLFGFASVSLVDKWCNPNDRACPSFWQILAHPVQFHLALHQLENDKLGLRRLAIQRLLGDAAVLGLLAEGVRR